MTIAIRQNQRVTTYGTVINDSYPIAPLDGSFLAATISTIRNTSVLSIVQTGVTWVLVEERSGGTSGVDSTRVSFFVGYPDNVSSAVTGFQITLSSTSGVAAVFTEFTGLAGDNLHDKADATGGTSPPALLGPAAKTVTDSQLLIGCVGKNGNTNPFINPSGGYSLIETAGGVSQRAGFLYLISSAQQEAEVRVDYLDDSDVWIAHIHTFKEFPADFRLDDFDPVSDQTLVEKFPIVESDTVVASGQVDVLALGGADGHSIGDPIRVSIESESASVSKSSIEIEVKYGAGAYQHVYENEAFEVPASDADSTITELVDGWALSVAPLGFWPSNTLIGVRVTADSLATPFEYSFTTADESPLVRGVTFIQSAIGRTP